MKTWREKAGALGGMGRLLWALAAGMLAVSLAAPQAAAQFGEQGWSAPLNLSNSGAASEPQVVVDSEGAFHVLWRDDFAGFVYTSGEGGAWSEPVVVAAPFGAYTPRLVADLDGDLHAFWINELGALYHGQVEAGSFADAGAWSGSELISDSAVAAEAEVDAQGRLHLAYLRALEIDGLPAGVYYRRLGEGGAWSSPELLYASRYLRSLTAEDAHLDVAADGTPAGEAEGDSAGERIYVAWDNRPRERVYLAKSADGGESWSEAVEIDRPEEGSLMAGPAGLHAYADGDRLLLLWRRGEIQAACSQYAQWSLDGGETWQPRQRLFEDLQLCPEEIRFLRRPEGPILMLTDVQVFLQAWDGAQWSAPQLQEALGNFVDPDTHRLVDFDCRQGVLGGENELYVVGCDAGDGRDIWLMKRPLDDVASWFAGQPAWSPPVAVASDVAGYLTPALVADGEGRLHALWSQPFEEAEGGPGGSIQYSRWEAGQWSPSAPILTSPEGKSEQPAAALDPRGRLLAAWSGGQTGQIYFSQAEAARAAVASAWSPPALLSAEQPLSRSPDVLVDGAGKIYVVYAVPLNEGRGVYLVSSPDGGESWSEPQRVFDAVAAGWMMVDAPRLAAGEGGSLHLLWARYAFPGDPAPQALFYTRSSDGGASWEAPQAVVDKPAVWSEVVGLAGGVVHRLWQEASGSGITLWHEVSRDGGLTWDRTSPVSVFGEALHLPGLAWDPAGRLHLLQIVARGQADFNLQHWSWDGERWSVDQNLSLDVEGLSGVGSPAAAVSPGGALSAVFSIATGGEQGEELRFSLVESRREVEVPAVLPTAPAAAAPTIAPSPTDTAAPEPTVTSTTGPAASPTAPADLPEEPGGPTNPWLSSMAGLLAAGFVVLVALIFGARAVISRQR